jgi:hypothetical protein
LAHPRIHDGRKGNGADAGLSLANHVFQAS